MSDMAVLEAIVPPAPKLLGLLEVQDRHGVVVTRVPLTQWPLTVGRALDADVVLDDGHVAAAHLRLERDETGPLHVQVLQTVNGVRQGHRQHAAGTRFVWSGTEPLLLGRYRLALRLADAPLAPEQALPRFAWGRLGQTLLMLTALVALYLGQTWLRSTEPAKFLPAILPTLAGALGVLVLWVGAWSMAGKLFSGQAQFARHLRIVCAVLLLDGLLALAAQALAFAFSWDALAHYSAWLTAPLLVLGLMLQLLLVAPQRRWAVVGGVSAVSGLLVLALLGSDWQASRRAGRQLYLSSLFPPGWRMAPAVPVGQFMKEADSIRVRLNERLVDGDEGADAGDEGDAETAQE